jgi:hypothetical protein
MKNITCLAVLTLAAVLVVFSGCSDNSTEPESNLTDAERDSIALAMQGSVDLMVAAIFYQMSGSGSEYLGGGLGGLLRPTDDTTYNPASYWWVLQFEDSTTFQSGDNVYTQITSQIDSVRFSNQSGHQQFPDGTTNGLELRTYGDENLVSASYSWDLAYRMLSEYAINEDTAIIDCDYDYIYNYVMGEFSMGYLYDCTCTDVKFIENEYEEYESHPIDGALSMSLGYAAEGGYPGDGEFPATDLEFAIDMTFTETGYSATMVFDGVTYNWSEDWQ